MSGDVVGKNGLFIPQQLVRRLQVPPGMENALLEYFQGRGVSPLWQDGGRNDLDTDDLAAEQRQLGVPQRFDEAEQASLDRIWPPERRRHQFLADLSHRRMIVSIGAGVGKSTLMQQIEYVIQKAHPRHFVLRIEMKDVPTDSLKFIHNGANSLLVGELRKKIESVKAKPSIRTRLPVLPKEDPQEQYLRTYLRAMLVRGDFTLLVDGADQIDLTTIAEQGNVLREFLGFFPNISCIVAGRPYSIVKIWGDDSLDLGQLDPVGSRKPVWEFIRIDRYTPDQLRQYLGGKKLAALGNLDSFEVRIPRTAGVLRTIPSPDLKKMDSDSDLYWYSQHESVEHSLLRTKEEREIHLDTSKIISLAAGVAFGLWTWKTTPVMYAPLSKNDDDTYGKFREHLHNIGVEQRLQRSDILDLGAALAHLSELDIDPLRMAVYRDRDNAFGLEFTDATIRDFYAAHWLARYLDDPGGKNSSASTWQDQRDLLLARRRGYEFERMWELLIAMPVSSIKPHHNKPSNGQSWCRAIESQYVRHHGSFGDSRLMYLAWERLLARADRLPSRKNKQLYRKHLLQEGFTTEELDNHILDEFELAMEEATVSLPEFFNARKNRVAEAADNTVSVMQGFLRDYCDHREGKYGKRSSRIIRNDIESRWCDCKADAGKRFKVGNNFEPYNKQREMMFDRSYKLCSFHVTVRAFELFDPSHSRNMRGNPGYSRSQRCPVNFVNWYDAMMFSIWSGGVLLNEWEREHACRGGTVRGDGSLPRFYWGDHDNDLSLHAWTSLNSSGLTREVGNRPCLRTCISSDNPDTRNGYNLHDMIGNCQEWCSNRFQNHVVGRPETRAVRGASISTLSTIAAACSFQSHMVPENRSKTVSFRIARVSPRLSRLDEYCPAHRQTVDES